MTLALVVALACLVGVPALAPAKKRPPQINPRPIALFDKEQGGVEFSVQVFHAKRVSIAYAGKRRQAEQILIVGGRERIVRFTWEALFKGGSKKRCYRIEVTAQNKAGTVTRKRKACRIG